MTNIGVHREHCCVLHGCKYGDKDCPVSSWEVTQSYICEVCVLPDGDVLEIRIEVKSENTGQWYPWTNYVYADVIEAVRAWHELTDFQEPGSGSDGGRPLDPARVRLSARAVSAWSPASPPPDYSAHGGE